MRLPSRRTLVVLAVVHLFVLGAGAVTGNLLSHDLPSIGSMDLQRLPQMTVLLDRNGARLHSFAEQRRTPVTLDRISPTYIKALLATEDPRFYRHIGVDLKAVARAVVYTVATLHFGQGGSTITQQLARDTFLTPKKTVTRKVQEAVLALTIEKNYTKREILELYCNRINFGDGRYGVETASQYFFGKKAKDLTLPEAALLAGLPQRPSRYSPFKNPQAAIARRNHVLDRMVEEGVLDGATAARAKAAPIGVTKNTERRAAAHFFVEEVRRFLARQFGEDALYRSGLQVKTTIDPELQIAAERAVRSGLDNYGRRHRIVPEGRAIPEGSDPDDYDDPAWDDAMRAGDVVPAVCVSTGLSAAALRIGDRRLTIGPEEVKWTRRKVLEGLLVRGRLYPVKVLEVDGHGRPTAIELASDPPVEAAFLALDPQTGDVLALVGGKDFDRSEFDRAMQAARQAGSAFKPFIYAAALEKGFSPGQLIWDVPTVWNEPGAPAPYQPENYDVKYEGLITLQHALEHSRNIPTVRLLDALGYDPAVEMGKRLGIQSSLKPYPSLALGAFEVKLVDLVAAYGSFVNGGILVGPQLVRSVQSPEGQELWSSRPETKEVLAPEIAAAMVQMLRGTTTRGTAAEAARLGRPTMGKTGTTDDFTDAWFIGCTPTIAAGAWIGFDQRRSLGRGETGGVAALPIWMSFLEEGLRGKPAEEFTLPSNVQPVDLDLVTGYRANPPSGCEKIVPEIFPAGKEPDRLCLGRDHIRARLPYPLQEFPLAPNGTLLIPTAEAARLVSIAPDKFQMGGTGRELRYAFGENVGSIPLAWTPRDWAHFLTDLSRGPAALEAGVPRDMGGTGRVYGTATGRDGWPAEIVTLNRSGQVVPPAVPKDP